jgi:hypothetical protein
MFFRKNHRYMKPADDGTGGGGGSEDRGDNWTPTDDESVVEKRLDPVEKVETAKIEDLPDVEKKGLKADVVVDEDATAAAAAEAAKSKKDGPIPLARHKEMLDRERERRTAVETELAQYKQGKQITEVNAEITEAEKTLLTLEEQYAKQITDGEAAKAAATMATIRRTERGINEKNAQMREAAAEARAVETVRFDTTVDRLEAQYPALQPGHVDFDKEKVAEVLELKEAYQLKGYTPSAALQKAVGYVMPPETKAQEKALETEARVDPKAVEAARKAAAVAKTAETIGKTPANVAKTGMDSDKSGGGAITAKDAMKMSHKAFSELNEASLAVMRGDLV